MRVSLEKEKVIRGRNSESKNNSSIVSLEAERPVQSSHVFFLLLELILKWTRPRRFQKGPRAFLSTLSAKAVRVDTLRVTVGSDAGWWVAVGPGWGWTPHWESELLEERQDSLQTGKAGPGACFLGPPGTELPLGTRTQWGPGTLSLPGKAPFSKGKGSLGLSSAQRCGSASRESITGFSYCLLHLGLLRNCLHSPRMGKRQPQPRGREGRRCCVPGGAGQASWNLGPPSLPQPFLLPPSEPPPLGRGKASSHTGGFRRPGRLRAGASGASARGAGQGGSPLQLHPRRLSSGHARWSRAGGAAGMAPCSELRRAESVWFGRPSALETNHPQREVEAETGSLFLSPLGCCLRLIPGAQAGRRAETCPSGTGRRRALPGQPVRQVPAGPHRSQSGAQPASPPLREGSAKKSWVPGRTTAALPLWSLRGDPRPRPRPRQQPSWAASATGLQLFQKSRAPQLQGPFAHGHALAAEADPPPPPPATLRGAPAPHLHAAHALTAFPTPPIPGARPPGSVPLSSTAQRPRKDPGRRGAPTHTRCTPTPAGSRTDPSPSRPSLPSPPPQPRARTHCTALAPEARCTEPFW